MSFSKTEALDFFKKAIAEHRLGHAYLITGSFHDGMESVAEELAALVLPCGLLQVKTHPDVHLLEPESKSRKILTQQMRALEEALHLKPQLSSYKIAIIHDADRMVPAAANAFLKTLEEPPDGTLLLLTTTLPEALLETIRSRCIGLPIYSCHAHPQSDHEKKVAELMELFFRPGASCDASSAFQLTRAFQSLLVALRKEASEAADEEFHLEKKHYAKTTDRHWEGAREEYFKAATEASVLSQRSLLLDVVASYFGERLRAEQHEFEKNEAEIIRLLRSLDVIEALRNSLEGGVQEALALEAGFLELMMISGKARD